MFIIIHQLFTNNPLIQWAFETISKIFNKQMYLIILCSCYTALFKKRMPFLRHIYKYRIIYPRLVYAFSAFESEAVL